MNNQLIAAILVVGVYIAGGASGWFVRAALESRAELAVVVDDGSFLQKLEVKTQQWIEDFNKFVERFYYENKSIPDCIAKPMPNYYHDNDYGLYPDRESTE